MQCGSISFRLYCCFMVLMLWLIATDYYLFICFRISCFYIFSFGTQRQQQQQTYQTKNKIGLLCATSISMEIATYTTCKSNVLIVYWFDYLTIFLSIEYHFCNKSIIIYKVHGSVCDSFFFFFFFSFRHCNSFSFFLYIEIGQLIYLTFSLNASWMLSAFTASCACPHHPHITHLPQISLFRFIPPISICSK